MTGLQAGTRRWIVALVLATLLSAQCSLFDPREPESPTQSSLDFLPPTVPSIVIANLQSSVAQKNSANYISCFADPTKNKRELSFIPSAEASAQYPGLLANWSIAEELSYFQNMVAKSPPNGFSSLLLTQKSQVISADSVVYNYDYTLTFEHTEAGFPTVARGNLQFTVSTDDNNFWMISRWSDFKTTNDITWSVFKGRFSN